jgi:hypothetical protein
MCLLRRSILNKQASANRVYMCSNIDSFDVTRADPALVGPALVQAAVVDGATTTPDGLTNLIWTVVCQEMRDLFNLHL